MKRKTITINGRKVKCRALKIGERILESDVTGDGNSTIWKGAIFDRTFLDLFRPISNPDSKKSVKVKARISFERQLSMDGSASFQLSLVDLRKLWPEGIPSSRNRLVRITVSAVTLAKK